MDGNNEKEFFLSKRMIIISTVLFLVIGGIFGYKYYISTPEYSLRIIAESIRKNDINTLYRHVDVHSIIEDFYNDFMYSEIENNHFLSNKEKKMTIEYMKQMRESEVNGIEDELKNTLSNKNNSTPKKKNGKFDEWFGDNSQNSVKYNGIKKKEFMGNVGVVTLDLYDNELNDNVFLKLRMIKLDDGKWKVIKIENLLEYYQRSQNMQGK